MPPHKAHSAWRKASPCKPHFCFANKRHQKRNCPRIAAARIGILISGIAARTPPPYIGVIKRHLMLFQIGLFSPNRAKQSVSDCSRLIVRNPISFS